MWRGFRLWIMVVSKIYPHGVDEFTGCLSEVNFGRKKCERTFFTQLFLKLKFKNFAGNDCANSNNNDTLMFLKSKKLMLLFLEKTTFGYSKK